jgi:branched-chain amino acid transport system permease protein
VGTAVGLQLLTAAAGRGYYLTQLTMAMYYTVVVMGLCLVMGYAGQISLGHGAFFAIGGYTSAYLTTLDLSGWARQGVGLTLHQAGLLVARQDLYGGESLGVTPWLAFVAAVILAAAVAFVIGYPALRLKGHYLAMATLGFGLIVYRIVLGTERLGGADGISSVPAWKLLPGLEICGRGAYRVSNYYVACALAGLTLLLILNLVNSRTGRALRSIHGGELAANAMGVNTARYKVKVFLISAVIAAVAGAMMTHYNGAIGPSEAGAMRSVRYVALVAAGGMANVWGALAIGASLEFLSLRGCFGTADHTVFGLILILIMALAPEGPLRPLGRAVAYVFRVATGRAAGAKQEA